MKEMQKIQKIKSAIVRLKCGNTEGTAFLVAKDIAITATHCVNEALEKGQEIVLTFLNIPEKEEFHIKANLVEIVDKKCPITALKLEKEVETYCLELAYFSDEIERNEKMFTYGYPAAKSVTGYPLDLCLSDYMNINNPYDYDISFKLSSDSRITDYSGMSGSPLIYHDAVIGVLNTEGIERIQGTTQAIDIGVCSNNTALALYQFLGILVSEYKYAEFASVVKESNKPKLFCDTEQRMGTGAPEKQEMCVYQSSYEEMKEELDVVRKEQIDDIYRLKLEGKINKAWDKLFELTNNVRSERNLDRQLLAKLYYIRALWYLEDKNDGANAQKYLLKVKDNDPDYDCRTYYAKKYCQEGNVIEEKRVLLPIDNKSVLNTYIQLCVQKGEFEEALSMYRKHKAFADHTTLYLIALAYILDQDYDMAEEFIDRAIEYCENAPVYVLMKGVIKFWRAMPLNIIKENGLLPATYNVDVVLADDAKLKMKEAVELFENAYTFAQAAGNQKLSLEILSIWLNALSVSNIYVAEAMEVVNKILEIDSHQWQAILYLYVHGKNMECFSVDALKAKIHSEKEPMGIILACIYVSMGKNDKKQAYEFLKKYEYVFKQMQMQGTWFELIIKCSEKDEQQSLFEKLEKSNLDTNEKMRLRGIQLEVMGENEKLLAHALSTYQKTDLEIDLINLLKCSEKLQRWEDVEKFSQEWKVKFLNPMAEISYIKSLAMQKRQKECLQCIDDLREKGKLELITDEVCYFEAQALKLSGRLDDAIEVASRLWEHTGNNNALFLLTDCYIVNGELQEAISVLREALRKEKSVILYQKLAEYEKLVSKREAAKYAKKAWMCSENNPQILLWAATFLYDIGESEKANELFVKLQELDNTNALRTISFKEAKALIEQGMEKQRERYQIYKSGKIPYHVYIDSEKNSSYTLYTIQRWNDVGKNEVPFLANFGGHSTEKNLLIDLYEKDVVMDYSSLLWVQHLEIWEEMKQCWEHIYVSCDINRMITIEMEKCMVQQPDVIERHQKIMDTWKEKNLNYLALPSRKKIEEFSSRYIEPNDAISYIIADENGLIWIEDTLVTDLMENSDKVPEKMRLSAVSTYELFCALERRGDISTSCKGHLEKYRDERLEIVNNLVQHEEKLSILVDENFLNTIYDMDEVDTIAEKCKIYVLENTFSRTEVNADIIKCAGEARELLEQIQEDLQSGKEEGIIRFCECSHDENRNGRDIHTAILLDELNFLKENKAVFLCDDRMVTAYDNMEGSKIFNLVDVLELLYNQEYITEKRYVNLITKLLKENYCNIVPPYSYMKALIFLIKDTEEGLQELSEEMVIVSTYLKRVCPDENKMLETATICDKLPETILYMIHLQKEFMNLLTDVWTSTRSIRWKNKISDWLLINFSEFGYDFYFFEGEVKDKRHYRCLQLANLLMAGGEAELNDMCQKGYYGWLFGWLKGYFRMEEGVENQTIDYLADIISGTCEERLSKGKYVIGVGLFLHNMLQNFPDYYAEKIRKHPKLVSTLELFDNSVIVLGHNNIIEKATLLKWIEHSMQRGLNNTSIVAEKETEYQITWVLDKLIEQCFELKWIDQQKKQHITYYYMEGALLSCGDSMLNAKGFFALEPYIIPENRKKYENDLKQKKNKNNTIEAIIREVKNNCGYREWLIRNFITQKIYRIYELDDLLPEEPEYFAQCRIDYPEEYYLDKFQWCQGQVGKTKNPKVLLHILEICLESHMSETEKVFLELIDERNVQWFDLYISLVKYIFREMEKKQKYLACGQEKCIRWAYYYASVILQIIEECDVDLKWIKDVLMSYDGDNKQYLQTSVSNPLYPPELSYVRVVTRPLSKILNQYQDSQLPNELIENWLIELNKRIREDFWTLKEAILIFPETDENCSHNAEGSLLDNISKLNGKYGVYETYPSAQSECRTLINNMVNADNLTYSDYVLLVVLVTNLYSEEYLEDIKNVIRKFPGEYPIDEAVRIAECICILLESLDKNFVMEYLPVLKSWLRDQFLRGDISYYKEFPYIGECVSQLESSEKSFQSYTDFWEEMLGDEVLVETSPTVILLLEKMTMIAPMNQVKRMRKVLNRLCKKNCC